MIHVVAYSGGKDSTALLLWAKENLPDFTAAFNDTGWEHPLTYEYIQKINREVLGGKLVVLKSEKFPGGMVELSQRKHRVASAKARFCTEQLKVIPMAKFVKELGQSDEVTVYQGIRSDESARRSAMLQRDWSEVYDCWVERPLFHWTAEQVFDMHRKHGVEPNPLYKMGAGRVGCWPCVLINHGELKRMSRIMPEVWERIDMLEQTTGRTFFPPRYIPARFCTRRDDATGVMVPTMNDVRKYLTERDESQFPIVEGPACMSIYNLCE